MTASEPQLRCWGFCHVWMVSQASLCLSTLHRETTGPLILVTYNPRIVLRKARVRRVCQVNPNQRWCSLLQRSKTGCWAQALAKLCFCPGLLLVGHLLLLGLLGASSISDTHWQLVWSSNFKGTSYFSRSICLPIQLPHHNWVFLLGNASCFAVSYHYSSLAFDLFPHSRRSQERYMMYMMYCTMYSISSPTSLPPAAFVVSSLATS